jgi:Chaperone of endosialidase
MKTTIRLVLTVLTFFCLAAVGPKAQAVVPPPDGGYPNFTTAEGQNALLSLTTGAANTAVGWSSLLSNATGSFNTATGAGTLLFNTADENTAFGAAALLFNTIGVQNTAVGTTALLNNTEGTANTATGHRALHDNSTGAANTATGFEALFTNADGFQNTATGVGALFTNADGFQNTATGAFALNGNTEGDQNTAVGRSALSSNTSGSGNIALGFFAGANVITADNVICIGAEVGGADVSDSCFIGNIYSNVQPIVGTDPDSVTITSAGRLGRGNVSSRRYKHDIQPMEKASELLYALKPVSFRYNKKYDATQTLAFGLIAEEVAEVYPDLVGRNPSGEPESVRYEQINAMLLNEFLKEHREVQELKKQVAALSAGLQKVSAQLEVSRPAPQTVKNND